MYRFQNFISEKWPNPSRFLYFNDLKTPVNLNLAKTMHCPNPWEKVVAISGVHGAMN
jgi:hypothetical protein